MNIPFDKVYVVSLITNKNRQNHIKYQFNDLGIDFEFIYGTDFQNFTNDAYDEKIIFPNVDPDIEDKNRFKGSYGCALTHYNAISFAYHLGYNNVLVIEDDACFIKDKNKIQQFFDNIPKDADFITWDIRYFPNVNNSIDILAYLFNKSSDQYYIKYNCSSIINLFGGMMYAIMNRKSMKLYLDNQHKNFRSSDRINDFFTRSNKISKYIAKQCILTDHINLENNFNIKHTTINNNDWIYHNIYNDITSLNKEDFYIPNIFEKYSRTTY